MGGKWSQLILITVICRHSTSNFRLRPRNKCCFCGLSIHSKLPMVKFTLNAIKSRIISILRILISFLLQYYFNEKGKTNYFYFYLSILNSELFFIKVNISFYGPWAQWTQLWHHRNLLLKPMRSPYIKELVNLIVLDPLLIFATSSVDFLFFQSIYLSDSAESTEYYKICDY